MEGENPAECTLGNDFLVCAYIDFAIFADMLDVIGAGATAYSSIDWYSAWMKSPERQKMESELQEILQSGKEMPVAITEKSHTEFSAPFHVQIFELTRRAALNYLRTPSYLISRLAMNVFGGKCQSQTHGHRNDVYNRVIYRIYLLQS